MRGIRGRRRLLAIATIVAAAAGGCTDEVTTPPDAGAPGATTRGGEPMQSASSTSTASTSTDAVARDRCEQQVGRVQGDAVVVARYEASTVGAVTDAFTTWGDPERAWSDVDAADRDVPVVVCIIHGDALGNPYSPPPPAPGATACGYHGYQTAYKVVVFADGESVTIARGSRCNEDGAVNRLPSDELG